MQGRLLCDMATLPRCDLEPPVPFQPSVSLEVSHYLAASRSMSEVLGWLAAQVDVICSSDVVGLFLLDPHRHGVVLSLCRIAEEVPGHGPTLTVAENSGTKLFDTAVPVILNKAMVAPYPHLCRLIAAEELESECLIPLLSDGQRVGSFVVGSRKPNFYRISHLEPFLELAPQLVSSAIALLAGNIKSIAEEALWNDEQRFQGLLDLNNALVSAHGIEEFVPEVAKFVLSHLPRVDLVLITQGDLKHDILQVHGTERHGSNFHKIPQFEIQRSGSRSGLAILQRRPVVFHDAFGSGISKEAEQACMRLHIRSGCALPLLHHGEAFGTLLLCSHSGQSVHDSEIPWLERVATQVSLAITNAQAKDQLERLRKQAVEEKQYFQQEVNAAFPPLSDIVVESRAMMQVMEQVRVVAATGATVLLLGETGTGKELVARAIHQMSPRSSHTLAKMNCAAIPTGLFESELFGHEKGAFTGAVMRKVGRMEVADGGTLFLDEVGDIPLDIQPKLLRALQENEFERLGSTTTQRVDVRLIAATNQNLAEMVRDREFRSDLFYRLNVFPIRIPPLRERMEVVPTLAHRFMRKYSKEFGRSIRNIPEAAMRALCAWHWPGNVRELENVIERAVILSNGPSLDIPLADLQSSTLATGMPVRLEDAEREHIERVLTETRGVIAGPNGAADKLGLKRTTLQYKMKKLGVQRPSF